MIIVDKALSEREQGGNPIKMAMVGAGFMGRGITIQILTVVRGVGRDFQRR
jgi:predicted homoserine dehydrogenase-like protein